MPVRHKLTAAVFGSVVTVVLVALPYRLTIHGVCPHFVVADAIAKGGRGSGHGGGAGGSGGPGGPGGGPDGAGASGKAGNQGKAGQGKKSAPQKAAPSGIDQVNPATGDEVEVSGPNIRVLHPDGMRETIRGGRYEMNDAKGRNIITRPATRSDRARLRRMISR